MTDTQTMVRPAATPTVTRKVEKPRHWNVILLDDDAHTYEYVIQMLTTLFGHSMQRAFICAQHVDEHGRVVVMSTHRELAELKREQIRGFGRDHRVAGCGGAMSAILEPSHGSSDA